MNHAACVISDEVTGGRRSKLSLRVMRVVIRVMAAQVIRVSECWTSRS